MCLEKTESYLYKIANQNREVKKGRENKKQRSSTMNRKQLQIWYTLIQLYQ